MPDIFTKMPGGSTPPPPVIATFDTLIITVHSAEALNLTDNLRYGTATTGGGFSTNQVSFLAANPGLTLQDFNSYASGSSIVSPPYSPAFTGFTVASGPLPFVTPTDNAIAGPDVLTTPTAVLSVTVQVDGATMTFTFSPKISAVGLNLANSAVAPSSQMGFTVKDGVTTITDQLVTVVPYGTFTTFAGYASTPT